VAIEAPPRLNVRAERMRLGDLKLLEVNARYMRHETFAALIANIRRDGALTQSPFAVKEPDGRYLVLSGNHRVKAAVEALGPDHEDTVLLTDEPLNDQQRLAIQLSHNALVGEDDPATLKRLYDALDTIDWREYSGLDDKSLALLAKVEVPQLSEPNLTFQPITLVFLPDEVPAAEAAWKEARALVSGHPTWLARMAEYDSFLDSLDTAGKAHDVKNIATALGLVLAVFNRHLPELQAGYLDDDLEPTRKGWAPLSSVVGTVDIPVAAAATIGKAIQQMIDRSEVTERNRWQALEYLAAEYLAGV
jgi:hypothetical protein